METNFVSIAVDGDEEDRKPHRPPLRWFRLIAVATATLFLCLLYLKSDVEISTSENLLLAVALFFAGKNKQLLDRSVSILKQIYSDKAKKLRCSRTRAGSSVEWYIGCEKRPRSAGSGVELYSNGDFYEGEFHKGSGVYTYFVNGRYEGDWVDGKYDGYGIESWARGSRYRGQYRQGLRHGVGLYRFYTGDSFAGEWCNGRYHGLAPTGVATLASSSAGSNTALAATTSETETDTPESTSATRSTAKECTNSQTGTATRGLGTRAGAKATECTLSEMAKPSTANGIVGHSSLRPLLVWIPSYEQFRLQGRRLRWRST